MIGLIYYMLKGVRRPEAQSTSVTIAWFLAFATLFSIGIITGTRLGLAPCLSPCLVGFSFICLIRSFSGQLGHLLVNRVAIRLGRISFSVYICHFFVLDIITLVDIPSMLRPIPPDIALFLVLLVTLSSTSVIASWTEKYIEDPGNGYGHNISNYLTKKLSGT